MVVLLESFRVHCILFLPGLSYVVLSPHVPNHLCVLDSTLKIMCGNNLNSNSEKSGIASVWHWGTVTIHDYLNSNGRLRFL